MRSIVESRTGALALGFRWPLASLSSRRLSPAYAEFRLRLKIKLSLEIPNLIWCLQAHGQSPHLVSVKKLTRSKGPFLHQHYPASTVIRPSPTPALTNAYRAVAGRDPAPGTGLPRYSSHLPDMLSSLPR